jgi:NAD(P)-dependent dehydrogenase (short-subunit alcohol dehydrogenase family)
MFSYSARPELLKDRVILVTGAGRGIGAAAARTYAAHGATVLLLHNASIIGPRTPLEQLSGENFMRVMHINVNAMFMLTHSLLPLLKLSQDASVVFTSSSVGRKGRAYWGAYGVSKFATEGLMQTLADELDGVAPVRSNSINPGATRTDMRAQAYPAENPLNNPTPEAIMPVYLYLMGPDSAGINGQAFDAQK